MSEKSTDEKDLRETVLQDIIASSGHVLLYGPPGTGKTTLANMAARGQTIIEVTFRGGEGDHTFWGQMWPVLNENGQIIGKKMESGPAKIAAENGHILIINEINHAGDDVQDRMHFLGDKWQIASVTNPDGSVTTIHPNFRMFATMNGIPLELRDAVRDRFKLKANIPAPSKAMLDRLDSDVRELCHQKYTNADVILGPEVTYRDCLDFCEMRLEIGDDKRAAHRIFGERDKAVAFIEGLGMIQAKIEQEREKLIVFIKDALTEYMTRRNIAETSKYIGDALKQFAKLHLRREYEKMLAE